MLLQKKRTLYDVENLRETKTINDLERQAEMVLEKVISKTHNAFIRRRQI